MALTACGLISGRDCERATFGLAARVGTAAADVAFALLAGLEGVLADVLDDMLDDVAGAAAETVAAAWLTVVLVAAVAALVSAPPQPVSANAARALMQAAVEIERVRVKVKTTPGWFFS